MTGSKAICEMNNSSATSGGYTTLQCWITSRTQTPSSRPSQENDLVTFFDNNQVLARNWRVVYDYKSKASAITTIIHIRPGIPRAAPDFSPLQWLYVNNQPITVGIPTE